MNPQYGTLVVTIGGELANEIPCIPATTSLTIDPHEVHISRPGCPGITYEKEVLERVVISFTNLHEKPDPSDTINTVNTQDFTDIEVKQHMKHIHFIFDPRDFGEVDLNTILAIGREHPKAEAYADDEGRWYYVSTTKPTKHDIQRIKKHNDIES